MRTFFPSALILFMTLSPHFVLADAEAYKKVRPATESELEASKIAQAAQTLEELREREQINEENRRANISAAKTELQLRVTAFNELPLTTQKAQKSHAQKLIEQAQKLYTEANYNSAIEILEKAHDLDPNDPTSLFLWGTCLYRLEQYEAALMKLRQVDTSGPTETERVYYIGLIHFKLREYQSATQYFQLARMSKMPMVSASAAFYEGVSHFTIENFTEAQKSFEWVLDNSKDNPELDKKADEYLERIAQAIQLQKRLEQKWSIALSAGLNYDSNILYSPDNDTTTSSDDKGGGRSLLQGSVMRKFRRQKESDWSAKLASLYMYSFDSNFSRADTWLSSLGIGYDERGKTLRKHAYQLSTKPYYETLNMDSDDNGTRENILNSIVWDNSLTIIVSQKHFSAFGVDLRKDDSLLNITDNADDADAFKYTLSTTQTYFATEDKKKALIGKLKYAVNDAKGANKYYNRYTLSLTYVSPTNKWPNSSWTLGVTAYRLTYPDSDNARKDTNLSLDSTFTRKFGDNWSVTGVGSYAANSSTVDDNQYNRTSLMVLANYNWND